MSPMADVTDATFAARRERLRASVARWADRIAAEAYYPAPDELTAVVALCQEYFLPVEAARVRRWMTP